MLEYTELHELLYYNSETGDFIRLLDKRGKYKKGDVAGHLQKDGYICIRLESKRYKAHRLAWLYMTGMWTTKDIDHVNGNKSDNRWCNLRECDDSQNQANRPIPCYNTTGYKGIYLSKYNRWCASIKVKGKQIHIGSYSTKEEAALAYNVNAASFFGEFARLNKIINNE